MSIITNYKVILNSLEFKDIRELIYKKCGINIANDQKDSLEYKLSKRLKYFNIKSFAVYHDKLLNNSDELQEMINVVTINETYFFREHKHFEFLRDEIIPKVKYDLFRCWSAAGSIGAEAYSTAMILDDSMNKWQKFEVVHSDINSEVSSYAKNAIYSMKFAQKIPKNYLKKYCLQGFDENDGLFIIGEKLKKNIKYMLINLTSNLPHNELGEFDVIFLRNIIIYFDEENKKLIVENVIKRLKVGGYLFMGHSESLHYVTDKVKQIRPSIYQKI